MALIAGIIVATFIIILIEVPSLIKKGLKREMWAFFSLMFFGTVLWILHVLGVNLPSPHKWIAFIYKPLSDLIFSLFK